MRIDSKIRCLLDALVSVHMALGVQPSDLADAAFEDPYQNIDVSKADGHVYMTVTFVDADEFGVTRHKMRYVYGGDRRLLRIEQKVGAKPFRTQWDREEAVECIVVDLVQRLSSLNSADRVEQFMSTVPEELRSRFRGRLRSVA